MGLFDASPGNERCGRTLDPAHPTKLALAPLAYLVAIGLSYIEIRIGLTVALGVPAYHLLIDRSDLYQFKRKGRGTQSDELTTSPI